VDRSRCMSALTFVQTRYKPESFAAQRYNANVVKEGSSRFREPLSRNHRYLRLRSRSLPQQERLALRHSFRPITLQTTAPGQAEGLLTTGDRNIPSRSEDARLIADYDRPEVVLAGRRPKLDAR